MFQTYVQITYSSQSFTSTIFKEDNLRCNIEWRGFRESCLQYITATKLPQGTYLRTNYKKPKKFTNNSDNIRKPRKPVQLLFLQLFSK